jgi:hypothetical protein
MTAIFPVIIWLCQMFLGVQCGGCVTEGVTEVHDTGTWVGATSPDESAGSVGVFFGTDGTVTFENHGS